MRKRFFDSSTPLLNPHDLVTHFTGKNPSELVLPERAIIVFGSRDLRRSLERKDHREMDAWRNYRRIYRFKGTNTIIVQSFFGGPNVSALVEELVAFGVLELVLWGYAGGIADGLQAGDIVMATGAVREDGTSYHYMDEDDGPVYSNWADEWRDDFQEQGFREGMIWTCDAIYRETQEKVRRYRDESISAVEMEIASFYGVCKFKGVKGIAFVIISDLLHNDRWTGGFHTKSFRDGARRLLSFMLEKVVK